MTALFVPIRLDGFFAGQETMAVNPRADFTRLPFNDGVEDVNSEFAYISENFISQPFQDRGFLIRPGFHLHWALPDALTNSQVTVMPDESRRIKHPLVPDRWLIKRAPVIMAGQPFLNKKAWIIESSYLHPEGQHNFYHSINIPYHPLNGKESRQPFRFMGRWFEIHPDTGKPVQPVSEGEEYYDQLTAVAYGEPSFASFYPNCHSVFGFYDPEIPASVITAGTHSNLQYELFGWYSRGKNDFATCREIISQLDWKWKDESILNNKFYEECELICFATIELRNIEQKNRTATAISIGNTGTEALSAFLAHNLDASNPGKIEEQLEAIQLSSRTAGNNIDLGPAYKEAFHEKTFSSGSGGHTWGLQLSDAGNTTDKPSSVSHIDIPIPDSYAHRINELNLIQQNCDRASFELESLKRQLFADWYKYMVAAYHPDIDDSLPDVDKIKFYIENSAIPVIQKAADKLSAANTQLENYKKEMQTSVDLFNSSGQYKRNSEQKDIPNEAYKVTRTIKFDDKSPIPGLKITKDVALYSLNVADCTNKTFQTLEDLPSGFAGLSCWIRINSNKAGAGRLVKIATRTQDGHILELKGGFLSTDGIGDFWKNIYINGEQPTPFTAFAFADLPTDQWFHLYLSAKEVINGPIEVSFFDNIGGSLAGFNIHKAELSEDELFNDMNMFLLKKMRLTREAAARFWAPNDPVVLITGDIAEPSNRYGFDGMENDNGLLTCCLVSDKFEFNKSRKAYDFGEFLLWLTSYPVFYPLVTSKVKEAAAAYWKGNPWHPLLLEWKVEIKPHQPKIPDNNPVDIDDTDNGSSIPDDFILSNYALNTDNCNLSPIHELPLGPGRIYTGSSILTPYAKTKLTDALEDYLLTGMGTIGDKFYNKTNHPGFSPDEFAKKKKSQEKLAYILDVCNQKAGDLISLAINAIMLLKQHHALSQSLGGLNKALLMLHQTMQLPVKEPIGFEDDQQFTERVDLLVGRENKFAPLPLFEFNPLRTGILNVMELTLVDSFGQYQALDLQNNLLNQHYANSFRSGNTRNYLPPRFAQFSRLSFRWRSASHNDLEMNSHTASSPVCGWIVPNYIDSSLMIYDQQGTMLGIIDEEAKWQAAPGKFSIIDIGLSVNQYLGEVIVKLMQQGANLRQFNEVLHDILEQIDPENLLQHLDLAMLAGRPIAIARATVNFEIKGHPAISQDWNSFTNDIEMADADPVNAKRTTDFWENVKIPIRIGEPNKLNDGVIGYWIDDRNRQDVFYTVTAPPPLAISANDEAVNITMLFDPRGKVHASCGVMPVKIISLPEEQFKPAIAKMSVAFFTRPLLTPNNKIAIPLPVEPGCRWSWLTKRNDTWLELATTGVVHKESFTTAFPAGEDIWKTLLEKGWLEDIGQGKAAVVPQNQWKDKEAGKLTAQLGRIQEILDKGHITPVNLRADNHVDSVVWEGWLRLSPNN